MDRRDYPAPVLVPGVEGNTRENVDLIYLFRDLELLRRSRTLHHRGFSWRDALSIRDDEGGLLVIPHPFGPGRTSPGWTAGQGDYPAVAARADYVETHNGSAIAILQVARSLRASRLGRPVGRLLPATEGEAFDLLARRLCFREFPLSDYLIEVRLNQVFRTSLHALYQSLRKQIAGRRSNPAHRPSSRISPRPRPA